MEEDLAVGVLDRVEGAQRGAVAGLGALVNLRHLVVPARPDESVHRVEVTPSHHDDDLVHRGVTLEGGHGVLQDRAAGDLDELLGDAETHPSADAAREDHCHVSPHPDVSVRSTSWLAPRLGSGSPQS